MLVNNHFNQIRRLFQFSRTLLSSIAPVDTLNDLIADLVAGTRVLEQYHQAHRAGQVDENVMVAVQKMCISHLVLGLNKICEFWEKYHQLVPQKHRQTVKRLVADLKTRGVEEFRNTVVAHVWDRKLRRARRQSEIMAQLERLTAGELGAFLRWLNNPKDNAYPATVLSIVETVRDSVMDKHQIQRDEVINR